MRRHSKAFLICGAILLAIMPGGAPGAGTEARSSGYVNFSFDQVDLRLLIKLVGEMTGKRFVVDDSVTGRITVVTPPQIPADEVYPLFLSILESSGYSVIEGDGMYRVVPLPDRSVSPTPVVGPEDKSVHVGVITKVIKVQNVSAVDLRKMIEPMVRGGKNGALAAFGPTNHLIITDTAENIARIERIIAELDKPGASRVVEVMKLQHAAASEVAAQLMAAMHGSETAATSVGRHIQQITEGGGTLPTDVGVVPAVGSNSLILVGTSVQLKELRRVVEMLDVETPSGYGRLNAIFLKYLSSEEAAKSLNALLAKTVDKDQRQRIAIEPSSANNALIVDASPQDFDLVKGLVDRLDRPPQQVMVEILIAEVNINKQLDLGVEWSTIETPTDNKTLALGRQRLDTSDPIMDLVSQGVFPQGLSLGVSKGTYTDANGVVQPKIPVMITALAQNRDVKILSDVPLWAQNNTEASVSVVDNIPLLRSTIEGGAGTARDVIQNIDRVDVGIKLKFTPHVNPDKEVTMQLNPSIEAIIDNGPANTQFAPTIAKREVSTTVTVPDRATIVISGLMREDTTKQVYKVPILGDIPLIGFLFRTTSDQKQRTNLLIFVTPHIVTEMESASAMKETLTRRVGIDTSAVTNMDERAKGGK